MTHGAQKGPASQTGQQRPEARTPGVAVAKERLRAVCPASRQAAVYRMLEEAPEKTASKEFVHSLDGIYNELSQAAAGSTDAATSGDIADALLSAMVPLGGDANGIATLVHVAAYTSHQVLRACAEQSVFHWVFDLEGDVKQLAKAGCTRLLAMVLISTNNLLYNYKGPDFDARIDAGATVAIELLGREEETPTSGKKDKNDVFNNITNLKLETRSMKKLVNKTQWDALCTELRLYTPHPPPKQLPKFVVSLRRTCEYVAFHTDMDTQADYVNVITGSFVNTRFQVDLLLHFVEFIAPQYPVQTTDTRRRRDFEKLFPASQHASLASVMWVVDTSVLCVLLALLYNKQQVAQFKTLIQQLVKEGSHDANEHLVAKAVIYALTDVWIKDHDLLRNREGVVKYRLATVNPLFWFCYELCLQQFISSEDLIKEIRHLGGESINGKACSRLFDFMSDMAKSLPGEYLILAILEVMRYVHYNLQVTSFMVNLFQGELMDVFKSTRVNFSKGVLEVVCYCRQTFDWGFMTMLIYSVDAIMSTGAEYMSDCDSRNEAAKSVLAGGFMDYLRWKIQQMRDLAPQGEVSQKIFVPSCNVVAEIFCILNHTIGTCDELLDLFQTYDAEYTALHHYNVLMMPLYRALEARSNPDACQLSGVAKAVPNRTPLVASVDLRDKLAGATGADKDIYSYLVLNEDIETTTSHVVDVILSCKLHQSILNAAALLNADVESLRSQTILDVLLHKYINRVVMVLDLSVPPDFCLHSVTAFDEEGMGVAPRLTMLAKFTGSLLALHLTATQCDSVYIIFRVIIEALRRNKVFLIEFAIEAFSAMGNVLFYPVFTRMVINDERFGKLYPQFVAQVRAALDDIDANIFEISTSTPGGAIVLEDTQCLKNVIDANGRATTGLMILKQSTAAAHDYEVDQDASSSAPNSASMVFSIVNLAANVQYKQLTIGTLWYQEQISMNLNTVSLDDLLATLKIDFQAPPNALEIMSIMEMSLSNKSFITHVEQLVTKGHVDWLLFVIYRYVLIRGYTHFRDCIVFLGTLGGTRMMDAMVKFTAYCLNVFLKYMRSCRGNAIYRKLLSVSSGWLGAITLGRNKPLLTKHLDIKCLILYAYENGLLMVVIPAVCKLLMNAKSSKIFKLPNPWTSSLLNLLADISMSNGLKSTLQFDLSLLFRNLDFVPGPRSVHMLVQEVPVSDLDRSPKLGSSIWSSCATNGIKSGAPTSPLEFQVSPVTQELRALLKRKIVLNPKVSSLNSKWPWVEMILNAIETCYMESSELVKKTMMTCVTTTRSLIITDFASRKHDLMDINPEMLKVSAIAMATGLATSLIMATAREQLCNVMVLRLHMQILSVLSMEPSQGDTALTNNLEQVSGFLAKDNLGLVCALVEQATLELITGYISASIGEWIAAIGKESLNVPHFANLGAKGSVSLDIYKKFGSFVPYAMTQLQKEKQQGSPQQGPRMNMSSVVPGFSPGPGSLAGPDGAGFMQGAKSRGKGQGYRLPDFMIIPPIDNLPTSLISCKVEEFEHRITEVAKLILAHPPTIPLLNNKYVYAADSSTLLLLSCLPRNHTLFTLLWSMDYMLQHAANQAECVESLINKVLKTSNENTKGLDVVSIVQEVEYSLLEMLSVACPLVAEIVTNLIPTLGAARLCQFVRHRLLKVPTVDRFMSSAMDAETLCRSLHKLILDGRWLAASDLPMSISKLATLDHSGVVQIHLSAGPVTVDYGELHRRLVAQIPFTPPADMETRSLMGHKLVDKERLKAPGLLSVPPAPGLTVQPLISGHGTSAGFRGRGSEHKVRTLRQLVLDKGLPRNKSTLQICEIQGKERYLSIFKDFLMSMETDTTPFYQSFNEHPPDAFLICTLMCALQMTYEPLGAEMKADGLPAKCHDAPVWTFCDGWALMVSGLSRNETFMLHKTLHVILGMLQHGVALVCFERILGTLLDEMEHHASALVSLGYLLTLCGPAELPEFGIHWINLMSRKSLVQHTIQNPSDWPMYHHLLVDALTSPHAKMHCVSTLLVTFLQRAPEFLCGYYLSLCDAVPPRAMQLRNLLTCAAPRSFKLPNPIILDDHVEIPSLNFTNHIVTVLKAGGLKVATDMFIHDPNEALVPVVMKELRVTDPGTFDVVLANHYVLYLIGTLPVILKKIPTSSHRASNSLLLLEKVVLSCISQARHMLLSCMTNHLRYPSVTTFSFVSFILRLFSNGDQPMQEQITLALLERLLITKPHPWGVLHLLFQLVKNPKYDFWNRMESAPEVEKHIRRIIQGCVTTPKPVPHGTPGGTNEPVN